jgi:hypothetical protein
MSGLVFSACRAATIKFNYQGRSYEKRVKINDPNYFQKVGFPTKGKVTFHDECGVSVSSESESGVSSGAEIAEALAAQGKAIKEAIEAAKAK